MISLLPSLALLASSVGADPTPLVPKFTPGEERSYTIRISGSMTGMAIAFNADVRMTVGEAKADGAFAGTLAAPSLDLNADGNPVPLEAIPSTNVVFDKFGLPTDFVGSLTEMPILVTIMAGYAPGKPFDVGGTFPIDWKTDSGTWKGEGKYVGPDEIDGRTVAMLQMKGRATLLDQPEGDLTINSRFDPEKGTLVNADGTIEIDGNRFEFTVTRK